MKGTSRESSAANERVEIMNPLWIINAMVAIFFAVGAILIAWS